MAIRDRINALSVDSIEVSEVEAEDIEDSDGSAVLVTVKLAAKEPGRDWDPDEFLTLRRAARSAAYEELSGQDVRLVYEEKAAMENEAPKIEDKGGKQSTEIDL